MNVIVKGPQDVQLTGSPEAGLFRAVHARISNFGMETVKIRFGNDGNARIPHSGDLLSKCYISVQDSNDQVIIGQTWQSLFDSIDLYIGDQLIDSQDPVYSLGIWPILEAKNVSENNVPESVYPLHFFFCNDWKDALPLNALQYHDVDIRIKNPAAGYTFALWATYLYLPEAERAIIPTEMRITQVQRLYYQRQLNLSELRGPVKYLAGLNNAIPYPILWWTFNYTNTDIVSGSSLSMDGVLLAPKSYTTGINGMSAIITNLPNSSASGTSPYNGFYINKPSLGLYNFTCTAWILPTAVTNGNQCYFYFTFGPGATGSYWVIGQNANGTEINFFQNTVGAINTITQTSPGRVQFVTGTWTHLVMVGSPTRMDLYQDNALVTSLTRTDGTFFYTPAKPLGVFSIGCQIFTRPCQCQISDVRMFNSKLSPTQIAEVRANATNLYTLLGRPDLLTPTPYYVWLDPTMAFPLNGTTAPSIGTATITVGGSISYSVQNTLVVRNPAGVPPGGGNNGVNILTLSSISIQPFPGISISCWIYIYTLGIGTSMFFSIYTPITYDFYLTYTSTTFSASTVTAGPTYRSASGGTPIVGVWTHVVGVYMPNKIMLYVNGAYISTGDMGGTTYPSAVFTTGKLGSNGGYAPADAQYSQLQIFSAALQPNDVLAIYNKGGPAAYIIYDNPYLSWPFTSSNVDSVTSLSPSYSSTSGALTYLPTFSSTGIRLINRNTTDTNGGNTWVVWNTATPVSSNIGWTVTAWVNLYQIDGGPIGLYDAYTNVLSITTSSTSFSTQYSFGTSPNNTLIQPTPITGIYTTGTWYHVALAYNSSYVTLYLNGTGSTPVATGNPDVKITTLRIGSIANQESSTSFNGFNAADCIINDLRFFTMALPDSAITSIYNEGHTGSSQSYDYPFLYFSFINTAVDAARGVSPTTTVGSPSYLAGGGVRLSNPSPGTVLTTGIFYNLPNVPTDAATTGQSTAMWVNFSSFIQTSAQQYIGLIGNMHFYYQNGAIYFTMYNGTNWIGSNYSFTPVTGTWYHLAGIYKTTTYIDIYVNGALVVTGSSAVTAATTTNTGVNFGSATSSDARSSDVSLYGARIYFRTLQASDVLAIYNKGGPSA